MRPSAGISTVLPLSTVSPRTFAHRLDRPLSDFDVSLAEPETEGPPPEPQPGPTPEEKKAAEEKAAQEAAQKKANDFAQAVRGANGCGGIDAVAHQIGAQVVANDQVRARDLPGPLQQAVLGMSIGEASPPFGSIADGVRVLMLCGRDDPQTGNEPSFDQVMAQVEDDRVNKRAQTYLRDLRRDAVIEYN